MDRHPKLKVMLAHGGGFTPYQAARWEHGWQVRPEPKKNISKQPTEYRRPLLSTIPSCIRRRSLEFMIGLSAPITSCSAATILMTWRMMDCVKHVRGLKISDADKATILARRGSLAVGKAMNVQAAKADAHSGDGRHRPDRRRDEQGRRADRTTPQKSPS